MRAVLLAPVFSEATGLPLFAELLQFASEFVELIVEGKNDLGGSRNVITVEQSAVTIQVGQDGFGDLESALLGLDQRGLEGVDVVAAPEALVADDCDFPVDTVDWIEVVFDAYFFEDVRVARIKAALFLDFSELATARAIEGIAVV